MSAASVCMDYLAAFARGDVDAIVGLVTDDFVNDHTAALGSPCAGRDEYRRRLPKFLADFDGLRYEVTSVVSDDDRVAVEYVMYARYDGHPIAIRGAMHFEIRDGKIARRADYWDSERFRQQIAEL